MLLSWQHNFLFIKTPKTAGTSIEVDLAGCIGDDAIVTPIAPPLAGHTARNYAHADGDFFNHIDARTVRARIGVEAFDRLFKFCVEREPVAKCLSHFHMLKRAPESAAHYAGMSWDDYCKAGKFPNSMMQYTERANSRTRLMVDRILPYETLASDLPPLLEALGVAGFKFQTQAKSEFSRDSLVRVEDVTDEQRETIYRAFKAGLGLHGLYLLPPSLRKRDG